MFRLHFQRCADPPRIYNYTIATPWIEVKQETEKTMDETQKNKLNKQTRNESNMASDGQPACATVTVNKREHQRFLCCGCEQKKVYLG